MFDPVEEPPVETLVARIETLERELRRTQQRLEALEELRADEPAPLAAVPPAWPGARVPEPALRAPVRAAGPDASLAAASLLPLIGRTLLVLAGGFMIRAMTDADLLPALAGVGLGLVYALVWIARADREARAGQATSAVFQGVAGGLIAYPLLWETTTRFGLLHAGVALAALVTVFGSALYVAQRRGLASLAVIQAALALTTAVGLLFATRELVPVALALLAMAALIEALAWRDLWMGLRWPVALALDGALLLVVWLGARPAGLPEGYPRLPLGTAVAATLLLPALYLVSLFVRTLRHGRGVVPFEVVQGTAALAIGLGGAQRLLASRGAETTLAGLATLALGAACYAAAFAFVERRRGRGRNFYFYSTAAGLLTLVGTGAVLDDASSTLSWLLLATTAAWCARRFERLSLGYHAALYLGAAMLAAGLIDTCRRDLFGAADGGAPFPTPLAWLAAGAALGVYALLMQARGGSSASTEDAPWWERVPQALAAALVVLVAGGVLVAVLAALLQPLPALRAAALATLRTAVLAALALGLASAGRRFRLPELTWLVYPLLLLGGLKLLLEDLPAGRPATLFLSFVLYGGALLAAPRLLRQPAGDAPGARPIPSRVRQ